MTNPAALFIAPFRFDITPPLRHSLLAGLVPPAAAHDDPLEAIGYVLSGTAPPIVVCALDWAGLMNESHRQWCAALAEAAGTTPDRVAVHCVHQHNAPFVCADAQAIAARDPGLPAMFDPAFFADCLTRGAAAVRAALERPRLLTHVAHGSAVVEQVGSNRRVFRDPQGRVLKMRSSACTDPELIGLPEGTIDPRLQTVAFYSEGRKVVACHYYATHPMSFYRDGRVTSDFCGLARKRRDAEDPGCTHAYFTGCAGNVAAGKYNGGSPTDRRTLTDRVHRAMVQSEASLTPQPISAIDWRTVAIRPPARRQAEAVQARDYAGGDADIGARLLQAFRSAWADRSVAGLPLTLSCLRLNEISLLHLPGEMFIEYQLRAQALRSGQPVAVAAYGDGGPWYVPTAEEYAAGGYEVNVAFCEPEIDALVTGAIRRLLR